MKRRILDSGLALAIFVVVIMLLTVQLTLLMPIRVIAKCLRAIRGRVYDGFVYQPGSFFVVGGENSAFAHNTARSNASAEHQLRSGRAGE